MRVLVLAALTSAASLLAPVDASACGAPLACGRTLPIDRGNFPANAPALFVACPDGTDCTADIALLGSDGSEFGISLARSDRPNGWLVQPDEPFVPYGAYFLRVPQDECGSPTEQRMTVTPEQPLPDDLGTAVVVERGRGALAVPTRSGTCNSEEEVVWADVELQRSAAFEAFAGVSALFAETPAGERELVGTDRIRVWALCGAPEDQGVFGGLPEGRSTITFRGGVVGAHELPPVSVDVDLFCETSGGTGGSGGFPGTGHSGDGDESANARDNGSGCSSAGGGFLGLLVAGALLFRKR